MILDYIKIKVSEKPLCDVAENLNCIALFLQKKYLNVYKSYFTIYHANRDTGPIHKGSLYTFIRATIRKVDSVNLIFSLCCINPQIIFKPQLKMINFQGKSQKKTISLLLKCTFLKKESLEILSTIF